MAGDDGQPECEVHRCESLADVLFQHGRVVHPLALVVVLQVRRQQVDGHVVAVVLEILKVLSGVIEWYCDCNEWCCGGDLLGCRKESSKRGTLPFPLVAPMPCSPTAAVAASV